MRQRADAGPACAVLRSLSDAFAAVEDAMPVLDGAIRALDALDKKVHTLLLSLCVRIVYPLGTMHWQLYTVLALLGV